MRKQTFVSIVGVLHRPFELTQLATWLTAVHQEVVTHFTDFEFVLVNNNLYAPDIDAVIRPLPEAIRQHVFLLNLSTPVDRNNAMMAALDRANGDYTIIFEFEFAHSPQLIAQLWEKSRTDNCDIVYLRAKERRLSWGGKLLYHIFHFILRRYSGLKIDPYAHHTRLISRRALNSLLRLRENSHYLKANYALVGYNTDFLDTTQPLVVAPGKTLRQQVRTAMLAITSYTTFLRTLMLWIFLFSVIVAGVSIVNAIKVKFTNIDIFGEYQAALSGWAFLVVIISVFFAITCLNLYVMSIYLSNIYAEIKDRPLYIIESVKRY
jgi:polyisoprenyl-phosphate glycosyltransferase